MGGRFERTCGGSSTRGGARPLDEGAACVPAAWRACRRRGIVLRKTSVRGGNASAARPHPVTAPAVYVRADTVNRVSSERDSNNRAAQAVIGARDAVCNLRVTQGVRGTPHGVASCGDLWAPALAMTEWSKRVDVVMDVTTDARGKYS